MTHEVWTNGDSVAAAGTVSGNQAAFPSIVPNLDSLVREGRKFSKVVLNGQFGLVPIGNRV